MAIYDTGDLKSEDTAMTAKKTGWVKIPYNVYHLGVQFPAGMTSEYAKLNVRLGGAAATVFCPVDPVAVAMASQDNSPQNIISVASGSTISSLYVEAGHRIRSLHSKGTDLQVQIETEDDETGVSITIHKRPL